MSADTSLSHQNVCYVHCSFCNSILAVSMPFNNMLNTVTVRCGHCTNLLYVNVGGLLQFGSLPFQHGNTKQTNYGLDYGSSSSSRCGRIPWVNSYDHQKYVPMNPPKKKQRVPSAYNRFIKEEIQRIKACNPDISHREAFGAAAKNWAHFPHTHFGLNVAENR